MEQARRHCNIVVCFFLIESPHTRYVMRVCLRRTEIRMTWDMMASLQVNQLTRTRSAGKIVNAHVVERPRPIEMDFARMRDAVHNPSAAPAKDKK